MEHCGDYSKARLGTSHPARSRVSHALDASFRRSASSRRDGAMPNAFIFRYRLLRSTPSTSAVRDMLPCCSAERPQDQVALEPIARLVQRQALGRRLGGLRPRERARIEEAEIGRPRSRRPAP